MAARKPVQDENPERELALLSGLGPTSARMLIEAGVSNVSALRAMGVEQAYRRLRFRHGRRVTTNFIYALETALLGIPWTALDVDRKAQLKEIAGAIVRELEKQA